MYPQQVHSYLRQFFTENDCRIVGEDQHYLTVQLTVDIDKRIMNRPFYWQYVEATNSEANPAQVTFITNQTASAGGLYGEAIHFGSPRMNQLFQATRDLGAYVQLFEKVDTAIGQVILTPWLGVNFKVSYCCDQTKEMLYSFGINLLTGIINEEFQETICTAEFDTVPADNAFHVQFIIKPLRALERLNATIEKIIEQDDHSWATEAKKRWQRDQRVLDYFYEEEEDKPECYEIEKKALEEQYDTKIKIEIINGGLFYLY
ncbi:YqhG family protein [Lysinibacillus xylanilyticus]|uniref:YqhG family protein n=1 Tax=Lysinibacillus xylanilyticus TaxID=582475 RepID=UPI002B248040|nr:YqhG family protein [Lysinibacillus xylanilyticus]MEB2302100.1 YqhG family protein [Lysinibacillus xylanilyticus]